jgi:hypothetical protein
MRAALLLLLLLPALVWAHDVDHPGVKVRVVGYDPATNVYNISCAIPQSDPTSQIDPRRFYAIDPIPNGSNRSYYSTSPAILWKLDAENYKELVHRKAMYHLYCEVQNYSAPAGSQNIASEVHVDLRTTDNQDIPTVYVLSSNGPTLTMKCDPPRGTKIFDIAWSYRNRNGTVALPDLNNQKIVNITLPKVGSGWDILCNVFDRETGKSTKWDMPVEVFSSGPAYVPTIEGCFPNEPCFWVSPNGIPPNSTLQVTISPGNAKVYINEVLKGTTDANGNLRIDNIIPGVYNLVARKDGYEELSTLVALPAGRTVSKAFALQVPTVRDPYNMCHTTIFSLPASCTGGSITSDTGTSCRTITCASGANSLKVQACNKPDGSPTHFEMYKQSQTGSGVKICLGNTCLQNEGFVASSSYPICLGSGNASQNITMTSWSPAESTVVTAEPNSQAFTYTLSNPSNIAFTRAWYVNGTLVGSAASYTFAGSYETAGTYAVRADVTSSQGTLTRNWLLTVNNVDPANSSNTSSPNTTCYSSVQNIPATCIEGSITDSWSGCRKLICTNAGSSMQVLACDKTGFFEMYKQSQTGTAVSKICIGTTCISDNGYAKSSNFPICAGTMQNTTSPPNTTNTTTPNASVSVQIAPWFPQGRSYVFKCMADGYSPSSYNWEFGDSHKQTTTSNDVYHTFADAGTYEVRCTAIGTLSRTGILQVAVT